MSELAVRDLHKSFGPVQVLRGVDLEVEAGTLAAVLGPSGCGKTTLLRVVAGFERADAGTVSIGGRVVTGVPPERRRVGIVPQEGALFPHLDVAGNVGFGLSRERRRSSRVGEVLDLVGLSDFASRMPHELSGGQQQRVALARALAPEPALVLLDEPFSALDSGLRAAVRAEVGRVLRLAGATAVLVTHDQEEALSMAVRVAVMRSGRLVQSGSPAEVYGAPADLGVATFVGDACVLRGTASGDTADCALGRVTLRRPATGAGSVVIRPEQLVVDTDDGRSGVPARVVSNEFYGHDALVHCDLRPAGSEPLVVASRRAGEVQPLAPGDAVRVVVVGSASFFAD
ncbi:MAG: ATP-binding cassette domain-containing protein [Propionibacteriales bacterium]|nr:ATP-binding cassette domain-containing protein [Propionibacteriales bacterium]